MGVIFSKLNLDARPNTNNLRVEETSCPPPARLFLYLSDGQYGTSPPNSPPLEVRVPYLSNIASPTHDITEHDIDDGSKVSDKSNLHTDGMDSGNHYHHNNKSMLLELPTELLLSILDFTSSLSRLSLRGVCVRLRECTARLEHQALASSLLLPTPTYGGYTLTTKDQSRFLLMLRRDARYRRQHDPSRFYETEHSYQNRGAVGRLTSRASLLCANFIEFPTFQRPFKAVHGRIRFCEHLVFSARCLHLALLDFRDLTIHCRMHERRGVYGTKAPVDSILSPTLYLRRGTKVELNVPYYLLRTKPKPSCNA